MKLASPPRDTSFYETFSDLIFCTLVIFIVIIMALVVQLRAEIETVVSPNRFTGGSATSYYVALLPGNGQSNVAWLPNGLAADFDVLRSEGGTDPVLRLAEVMLREPDGLTITPADAFISMGDDVSHNLAAKWRTVAGPAHLIYATLEARRRFGDGVVDGWSPAELKRRLGGLFADQNGQSAERWAREAYAAYNEWAFMGTNYIYKRRTETLDPMVKRSESTKGAPPRLRFAVTDDRRFTVGEYTFDAVAFRNILRSIVVGKGFFIEYATEPVEEPPAWVLDEVLSPVGFDSRVVSDDFIRRVTEDD